MNVLPTTIEFSSYIGVYIAGLPNLQENAAGSIFENQTSDERERVSADEMIREARTMITIIKEKTCRASRGAWNSETHESSHSRKKLRLHGLPFRKTAANEDAVVSNFMRDLMSEARQCRSGADQGT